MNEVTHIFAVIIVDAEHASRAESALARCIIASRHETACEHYVVNRDLEKQGRFIVDERWATAAAFDAHLATPHFKTLAAELGEMNAKIDIMKVRPLDTTIDTI